VGRVGAACALGGADFKEGDAVAAAEEGGEVEFALCVLGGALRGEGEDLVALLEGTGGPLGVLGIAGAAA
jgi:hypothetical protein